MTTEYTTKTMQYKNCTIIVERPILLKTEQEKREAHVKAAAERVMRDYLARKERGRPEHDSIQH